MNTLVKSVLTAVLVLACIAPVFAAQSTFPDIQRILDEGKLRVAIMAGEAPPMFMNDDEGTLVGFDVDLARSIGKKLGVAVEFVRTADTYDGVVDVVAGKQADIAVSFLSSGVHRAMRVLLSQPYVTQNRRVFYNRAIFSGLRRKYPIETIGQLARTEAAVSLEFGVLEGSIYAEMMERDMPQFRVKSYGSLPEIVTAVKEGRIFAGLHGELQIKYYMRQNPETAIYVAVEPRVRHPSDISIAVRPDAPNLLRWVNIYLDNHVGLLETGELVERYLKK